MSGNLRSKKRRLVDSADISRESTINEISHSRVLRSSGKLITSQSHAVITTEPLTLTLSGAVSPEMDNPSEISYSVNTGKKKKPSMPEIACDDSSKKIHYHQPSCDAKLLDAINTETSREAMALLTSEKTFTQEVLNQALISACRQGHKLLVQTLVRAGANIEHRDEHGNTPLLICAENGFTDIVRFLVSRHANINAVNSVGNTALILSVRPAGSIDLTRFLLEQQDIDIHHENQHGHTALLRTTHFMDVDAMRLLLQKSIKRKTVQTFNYVYVIRQENVFSFHKSRSQEVRQQFKVVKTGLKAVYRILQDHLTTQTSPLELAIKAGDTKSLDIFLDCQFSSVEEKKRFIDCALKYVFRNNQNESGERFSSADVQIIQKLLQYGADVNPCDGPRLISLAVESGNLQLVELLCTHGADLKTCYPSQQDPVCIAAGNGRWDLIEILLKYNADVSTSDFYNSPLYYALSNGHTECAKLLIQSGAKMSVVCALRCANNNSMPQYFDFIIKNYKHKVMNYFSQKPLEARDLLNSAVLSGKCEIVGHILGAGAGISEADSFGQTLLMASRNADVAELLINRGVNVNREIEDEGGVETLLTHMIGHRQLSDASTVELCKVLVDHGALVNCRNGQDKTPLMLAAWRADCVSMLQMLLENGADINDKDSKGNTVLFHAVMGQKSKNVTCLIDSVRDKKSLINVQNNDGLTPLIVSVRSGNVPFVKELIENGADVNMKDNKKNLALHHLLITCPRNREEILTVLLEAGSHVNCQNSNGLSPLMLAASRTMASMISPLLDAGADVNAVSKKNTSATALSFLPDEEFYVESNAVSCIETLVNRGANCSYLNYQCFHKLISENQVTVIPKLIQNGLAPAIIETNKIKFKNYFHGSRIVASPLLVALLCGQIHLARYFVDILFLSRSDLSMFGSNKDIADLLEEEGQELSSRPMSLMRLCLVTVSTRVGPWPGRETKVDSLPLPQMMKDRLLFKSVADEHAALSEISSKANTVRDRAGVSLLRNWNFIRHVQSMDDDGSYLRNEIRSGSDDEL